MKVLVTGGAGYIGSIFVPCLLREGHEVTVVDSFMYKQNSLLDVCAHKNLQIVCDDVRNEKLLLSHLKQAEVIFPLACLTGAPICDRDPWTARAVNRDAIEFIAKNKSRDQWVIFS